MTGREDFERLLDLEHEDMITDADRDRLTSMLAQSEEYRRIRQEYRLAKVGLRDAPQAEPSEADVASFKRRLRLKLEAKKPLERKPRLTFSLLTRTMSYAAAALVVLAVLIINLPSDINVPGTSIVPVTSESDDAEALLQDLFAAHEEVTLVDMVPVTETGDLDSLFEEVES